MAFSPRAQARVGLSESFLRGGHATYIQELSFWNGATLRIDPYSSLQLQSALSLGQFPALLRLILPDGLPPGRDRVPHPPAFFVPYRGYGSREVATGQVTRCLQIYLSCTQ